MTGVLIVIGVIVIGWFAAGSVWNIRKGHAAMRWLQDGLPLVGERTTLRWLGTTSVEMVIGKASAPFAQAAVVVFMEPRDIPWLWALSRRRGRRDTLVFRARLARAPKVDLEILDPASWSGRDAGRRMASERWSVREPADGDPLSIMYKFEPAAALGNALLGLARPAGLAVRRLAVHQDEPHLEVHVDLPHPRVPAAGLFATLRAIGERASSG